MYGWPPQYISWLPLSVRFSAPGLSGHNAVNRDASSFSLPE
jgi:hypothetical protein